MEAQYFEKETRSENSVVKILMIAGTVLVSMLVIYTFFAIQNTAKQTQYVGSTGSKNTINISETGTVYARPDIALVTFSTITQKTTISEALSGNSDKISGVTGFLEKQGIQKEDIKVVDFNIYPQYEWQTKGVDLTIYPLGKRVIVGYQAVESVEVTIRNIELIGKNIQGALSVGASQVSGLKFVIDKEEDFKKQAREQALTSASARAGEIAKKMGVKLGKPVGFTESYFTPTYSDSDKATAGTGSNFQIAVRESKIEVTVNVSYEIK
ncbi:MAG: SIMPL domain-containing protein [Candidatus Paceibacterota bacterium]|jgi:hypothetical protein